MASVFDWVYAVVRQIPPGRVATYGTVARLTERTTPRAVGFALHALPPGTDVPWHRVINAQGTISVRGRAPDDTNRQWELLVAEGVTFTADERIDLARYAWNGPAHLPPPE